MCRNTLSPCAVQSVFMCLGGFGLCLPASSRDRFVVGHRLFERHGGLMIDYFIRIGAKQIIVIGAYSKILNFLHDFCFYFCIPIVFDHCHIWQSHRWTELS